MFSLPLYRTRYRIRTKDIKIYTISFLGEGTNRKNIQNSEPLGYNPSSDFKD
jgi:hypothetical protein